MGKLAKQKYTTAKGERKVNCYMVAIPKKVVEQSCLEDNDDLAIYVDYGMIVINKKYHCTCMECGFEWDEGKPYSDMISCPKCHCGDIKYENNGE